MQKIIVAEGIEIRDFQGRTLVQYLNSIADAGEDSVWTFPKGDMADASHEVKVIYTMAAFADALDTTDAYVIYEGHSRYGQGPAFGAAETPSVPDKKAFPVNPWGEHFRMGYDATDTECIDDLVKHSVMPREYDLRTAPASAFLPSALRTASAKVKIAEAGIKSGSVKRSALCLLRGAWRPFVTCHPALATFTTARDEEPLKGRHYYAQKLGVRKPKEPSDEFLTSVEVGAGDLAKSFLKCKVLFMASCSSHVHYFKPLDKRRKTVRSDCKFYMTGMLCSAYHARNFLEQIFKGHDPTSKKGSIALLKALNGAANSGLVDVY